MSTEYFPGTEIAVDSPGVKQFHSSNLQGLNPGEVSLVEPYKVDTITANFTAVAAWRGSSILASVLPDRLEPIDHSDISAYGLVLKKQQTVETIERQRAFRTEAAQNSASKAQELPRAQKSLETNQNRESYKDVIASLRESPTALQEYYSQEDAAHNSLISRWPNRPAMNNRTLFVMPDGQYCTIVDLSDKTPGERRTNDLFRYALISGDPRNEDGPTVTEDSRVTEQEVFRGSGTFASCIEFRHQKGGSTKTMRIVLGRMEGVVSSVQVDDEAIIENPLTQKEVRLLSGVTL